MKQSTKEAILALAVTDPEATKGEKDALTRILNGTAGNEIVKIKDAAKASGLHVNTIRNLVKRGRIKAVKGANGRTIGIAKQALDEFLR